MNELSGVTLFFLLCESADFEGMYPDPAQIPECPMDYSMTLRQAEAGKAIRVHSQRKMAFASGWRLDMTCVLIAEVDHFNLGSRQGGRYFTT